MRMPAITLRRSSSVAKSLCQIRGLASGRALRSETLPWLVGFRRQVPKVKAFVLDRGISPLVIDDADLEALARVLYDFFRWNLPIAINERRTPIASSAIRVLTLSGARWRMSCAAFSTWRGMKFDADWRLI
jgi:hypothetical protein